MAKDGKGGETAGPVWNFTTVSQQQVNRSPSAPSNPNPTDGATNVSLTPTLSWQCSDPDGDILTYNIYFGTIPNFLTLVRRVHGSTSYQIKTALNHGTRYYWKIIATDGKGGETAGPVWSFTTLLPIGQTKGGIRQEILYIPVPR